MSTTDRNRAPQAAPTVQRSSPHRTRDHRQRMFVTVAGLGLAASLIVGITGISAAASPSMPQASVSDTFARTVGSGWGSAATGGVYTTSIGATGLSVADGAGVFAAVAPGHARAVTLNSVQIEDVDAKTDFVLPTAAPTGFGVHEALVVRKQASGSGYRGRIIVYAGSNALVSLVSVSSTGIETLLGMKYLSFKVVSANKTHLEVQATGSNPVTLKVRAWLDGTDQPDWQLSAVDKTNAVPGAGSVGLWTYASSASEPVTVRTTLLSAAQTQTGSQVPTTTPVAKTTTAAPPTTALPVTSTTSPPSATTTKSSVATPTSTQLPPLPTSPISDPVHGQNKDAGSATVGATSYPIPSGAVFVSTSGSDSARGSVADPMRTVQAAVNSTPAGGTVVVRGGVYHETVTISGKQLTLQSYPGEAVWFDGSSPVTNWAASNNVWVATGWTSEFDSSPTYVRGAADSAAGTGFINPAYPMAAHPDQVFIAGIGQAQVGSLGQVKPGTFFVDYSTNRLYLGSNPAGKDVRASDVVKAFQVVGTGSILRGFGIRRYAPSVPDMGAVSVYRPNVTVENVDIEDVSTQCLNTSAANVTLRNLTARNCGLMGVQANESDNLLIDQVLAEHDNSEHFNGAPAAGGIKVTRSRGISVINSDLVNNDTTALWFDESVYNITITGNRIQNNGRYGAVIELSARAVVADNLFVGNVKDGLFVTNSFGISIWNNTFVKNARGVWITQDARVASNKAAAGHDPRQPFPDPTMTWIVDDISMGNNVISQVNGTVNTLFAAEQWNHLRSGNQMGITANGDLFNRLSSSNPTYAAVWAQGGGAGSAGYATIADFTKATGQEKNSTAIDGVDALTSTFGLTSAIAAVSAGDAQPLPAEVAVKVGEAPGTTHLGAWL